MKWIESVTQTAQAQIKNGTNKNNPLGGIRMWKFLLNLIARAHEFPEVLAVGGLLIFAVSYVWVASVFCFMDVGVTKLTLPRAEWPNWLDSIFFPVLGSNIARTPLLTVLVALHGAELALLAYVLWNFLAAEIDRFRKGILKYETIIDDRIKLLEADLVATSITSEPVKSQTKGVLPSRPRKGSRNAIRNKNAKNTSSGD